MDLRRSRTGRFLASTVVLTTTILLATVRAEDGASPSFTAEQVRFYETQVRPILETHCLKCHGGAGKVKGGLRLDSRAAVLKGGELGPAVTPEQPDQSLMLQAVRYEELEMPPGGKLPAGEQAILTRWVKEGLPWGSVPAAVAVAPAAAAPSTGPAAPSTIAAARREWSHRPVVRPPVPAVKDARWLHNPIDAFLLARLEAERLRPRPRPIASP